MAIFDFLTLRDGYFHFLNPLVEVMVGGKDIVLTKDAGISIGDVEVEMTCGFEASMATFVIYGAYDNAYHRFEFEAIKKLIYIGTAIQINLGYREAVRDVFRGFIARVRYIYQDDDFPGIEITAMDVKGIMMANNNSRQLKANTYKDAINEIFSQSVYKKLVGDGVIIEPIQIDDTPDKETEGGSQGGGGEGQNAATDKSIEMVSESDYEFVVKAAKKLNFEFYSVGGNVYFRKAKKVKDLLFEFDRTIMANGLKSYSIEYDITGLVGNVEVRGTDVGKGKLIVSPKRKINNKISLGSKAKPLVSDQNKVYIDPTIHSKEEADFRASYIAEDIAYRFGTLDAKFRGLPELTPGFFISFKGFGDGIDNTFYLTEVRHSMTDEGFYTFIKGKAASIDGSAEENSGV